MSRLGLVSTVGNLLRIFASPILVIDFKPITNNKICPIVRIHLSESVELGVQLFVEH